MSKLNPSAKPFSLLNANASEFRPVEDIRTYVNTKTGQEMKLDRSKVPNLPSNLVEKKGGKTRRRRRIAKKKRYTRKH